MKKLLALCLALVIVVSVSVTAFAAGGFIESPSNNPAPEIIEVTNEDEDCEGEIVITPYPDRDKLPDDERAKLEDAYDSIASTDDVKDLNEDLKELADDKNLGVSDLFNMGMTGCEDHDGHGAFKIKLKADTLKNFVGLLRFDGKNWILVEGASVSGEYLSFNTKEFGPFAVVVDTGADSTPKTGEDSSIYFWIMVFAGSALAVVVLLLVKKRKA